MAPTFYVLTYKSKQNTHEKAINNCRKRSYTELRIIFDTSAGKRKQDTASTGYKMKKGARKAGDKTSELGAKGVAEVKDKTYADKVGPDGQTIYIDKHSKYYYINKKGDKVYVTKLELKDKPQN